MCANMLTFRSIDILNIYLFILAFLMTRTLTPSPLMLNYSAPLPQKFQWSRSEEVLGKVSME